ncbi:unnamed protein product [Amoebophrya sp. A120]|nr:unnamed protein product [Amoebophrya sp. A120]|eukprot:GSA120T00011599001.1
MLRPKKRNPISLRAGRRRRRTKIKKDEAELLTKTKGQGEDTPTEGAEQEMMSLPGTSLKIAAGGENNVIRPHEADDVVGVAHALSAGVEELFAPADRNVEDSLPPTPEPLQNKDASSSTCTVRGTPRDTSSSSSFSRPRNRKNKPKESVVKTEARLEAARLKLQRKRLNENWKPAYWVTDRHIASLAVTLAKFEHFHRSLVQTLAVLCIKRERKLSDQSLALVLYSFAKLRIRHVYLMRFAMERVQKSIPHPFHDFSGPDLSLQDDADGISKGQQPCWKKKFRQRTKMGDKSVILLAYAFGRMGLRGQDVWDRLGASILARLDHHSPLHLSVFAAACARVGHIPLQYDYPSSHKSVTKAMPFHGYGSPTSTSSDILQIGDHDKQASATFQRDRPLGRGVLNVQTQTGELREWVREKVLNRCQGDFGFTYRQEQVEPGVKEHAEQRYGYGLPGGRDYPPRPAKTQLRSLFYDELVPHLLSGTLTSSASTANLRPQHASDTTSTSPRSSSVKTTAEADHTELRRTTKGKANQAERATLLFGFTSRQLLNLLDAMTLTSMFGAEKILSTQFLREALLTYIAQTADEKLARSRPSSQLARTLFALTLEHGDQMRQMPRAVLVLLEKYAGAACQLRNNYKNSVDETGEEIEMAGESEFDAVKDDEDTFEEIEMDEDDDDSPVSRQHKTRQRQLENKTRKMTHTRTEFSKDRSSTSSSLDYENGGETDNITQFLQAAGVSDLQFQKRKGPFFLDVEGRRGPGPHHSTSNSNCGSATVGIDFLSEGSFCPLTGEELGFVRFKKRLLHRLNYNYLPLKKRRLLCSASEQDQELNLADI